MLTSDLSFSVTKQEFYEIAINEKDYFFAEGRNLGLRKECSIPDRLKAFYNENPGPTN